MAIRSTRSSINFWLRIALTQRNRRTPHADVVGNFTPDCGGLKCQENVPPHIGVFESL